MKEWRHYLTNISGRRTGRKQIVFESDDWGTIRVPSKEVARAFEDTRQGIFNRIDALETATDLEVLFGVLRMFRDKSGRHPVITANTLTANPDFEAIRASGYESYVYEPALCTYARSPHTAAVPTLLRQAMQEGIYRPQFHGREHVQVNQWLRLLRGGDALIHRAFDWGMFGIDAELQGGRRSNLMAAFDADSPTEVKDSADILTDGLRLFELQFGFRPLSFIAPCYVWHPDLEPALHNNGIRLIQGLPYQYAPNFGTSQYRRIYHRQGSKSTTPGLFYLVRNAFFEPSLQPNFDWVGDCLRRIRAAFFWGKPAIIGTHRINFSGAIDENNRNRNLPLFRKLLEAILSQWPDVEFISSDELLPYYQTA